MNHEQFVTRSAMIFATISFVAPATALDMRISLTSGDTHKALKDNTLGITRVDDNLFWRRFDGKLGISTLLNTLSSGRKAVELGAADKLTVKARSSIYPRPLVGRFTDLGISVLDYGLSVGTGGDDSAAINAAIASASAAGGPGVVLFPAPPSGAYNVCASSVQLPGASVSLRLQGTTPGAAPIRIMPGCTSGITEVIYQPLFTTPLSKSKVYIDRLTIDAYCTAKYALNIQYAVGFTVTNSLIRNAAKGGSTVYIKGGYELEIAGSNRIENVNDDGHTCYKSADDLPAYGLETYSTDSYFNRLVVIGAREAYVYDGKSGNNHYFGTHAWGFAPGQTPINADFRAKYAYQLLGNAHFVGAVADSFKLAGFYVQKYKDNDYTNAMVLGSYAIGVIDMGAYGTLLDTGVKYATIIGNNWSGVPNFKTNAIGSVSGPIDGTNQIFANMAYIGNSNTEFGPLGGDHLAVSGFAAGGGAQISTTSTNPNANLYLSPKGGGATLFQNYFGTNALTIGGVFGAVNYSSMTNAVTGASPALSAQGADTDVAMKVLGKGASGLLGGGFTRATDPTTTDIPTSQCADWLDTSIGTARRVCNNGGTLWTWGSDIKNVAGGDTLHMQAYGSGGGGGISVLSPAMSAPLYLVDKGGGGIILQSRGATTFSASNPHSAINYVAARGAATGNIPALSAQGADTNIPMQVIGKGSSGALTGAYVRTTDPTTTDIPSGQCADWSNMTAGTMKRWCNVRGILKSIDFK